ncbi:MAG: nucleoside-diphosphate sugar epimerase/dehydratase [Aquirhabdus sp.]
MKKLLNSPRHHKQILALFVDMFCLPLVFCLSVWLRYDSMTLSSALPPYYWLIFAAPIVALPIFIKLGLYRAVIRFIDDKIVYIVIFGVTLSVLMLLAAAAFTNHMTGLSRGVFGIYWISAILYVLSSRFIARSYFTHASGSMGGKRVAIYGAGRAGTQLASALSHTLEYKNVAFIDDKKELQGVTIAGIKVFSSDDLEKLIIDKSIEIIMLAMPSQSKARQKEILDFLVPLKVKVKITPPIKDMVNAHGDLRVEDVREIEIEDLLGREPVDPDSSLISKCIVNKSVLVTGAGGSIGSELCRQILRQNPKNLILLERTEFALYAIEQELQKILKSLPHPVKIIPFLGSVLDEEKCFRILQAYKVETIYHAAAYKHVPLVEHNPIEGIQNNILGTLTIAKAALKAQVNDFVLISTDKAVRPTNVMGATKRFSELILQALSNMQQSTQTTKFCMVRFGNVLGSSGSVVPLFRKQILEGGPITITHPEITRYFMTIPEAAQLVLQAGAMSLGGDVFVLDMGEPVKIVDLAKRMVNLSGLELKTVDTPHGTIAIHHVGLRPGEKLYEELLIGDNVCGTLHPLIMRAQETYIEWDKLQVFLSQLMTACQNFDHEEVRNILLRSVVEYAPQSGIEDFIWRESSLDYIPSLSTL